MENKLVFSVTKTFESKQKKDRSNIDYFAAHPQFWGELPVELTPKESIAPFLNDGKIIALKVSGYLHFFVKPIDTNTTRNGAHILCGVLARNRQKEDLAGAYLINPDQIITKNEIELLRNSDRYRVRLFPLHFDVSSQQGDTKKSIFHKEIKSLSFLDKEVF